MIRTKSLRKNRRLKLLLVLLAISLLLAGYTVFRMASQKSSVATEDISAKPQEKTETVESSQQTQNQPTSENINNTIRQDSSDDTPAKTSSNQAEAEINRPVWKSLNREVNIGNSANKKIALTMDAGSGAEQTPKILDILKQNGIRASFSLTGKWIEQNPALVKRMIAEGHSLINHTYSHPYLTKISDEQIKEEFSKTEDALHAVDQNATMKPYFRPPYGDRNQHVWDYAASLGYQSIYWTVDAWDWKPDATADIVKNRIYSNEKNGAIILMHVGDDITPAVLPEVLAKLKADGYQVGNLESVM